MLDLCLALAHLLLQDLLHDLLLLDEEGTDDTERERGRERDKGDEGGGARRMRQHGQSSVMVMQTGLLSLSLFSATHSTRLRGSVSARCAAAACLPCSSAAAAAPRLLRPDASARACVPFRGGATKARDASFRTQHGPSTHGPAVPCTLLCRPDQRRWPAALLVPPIKLCGAATRCPARSSS